jgi:hypothetical protein
LTDINNTVYSSGALTAIQHTSPFTVFTAPDLQQSVAISGVNTYDVHNQFFELTDQVDSNNNPLYYQHPVPFGVTDVTILDLQGNIITTGYTLATISRGTFVFHSFPSVTNESQTFVPYQIRYIDAQGFLHLEILSFDNVISYNPFNATPSNYTMAALSVTVAVTTTFYIRWYTNNGYQALPPYGTIPNDPWFVRVRFNLTPTPPEYGTQVWTPNRPYILATWVPGTVLSNNTIQFERRPIYFSGGIYPDVLIYDQNYNLKYALAGKTGNGFLYPWRLNQFTDIDVNTGQVQIALQLDPTDIVFGFYSYQESDVVFTELDINPYTNPSIRNRIVTLYEKTNGEDLLHYLYYQILNEDGSVYATNDPSTTTGTNHFFSTLLVGQATSVGNFTFTDIRQRGGGLAQAYQDLPQGINFWDIGYWDGKPYPSGGAMIVYLPVTLQDTFSTDEISQIIGTVVPMGTIPVIRYYDNEGNETVA